GATVQTIGKQLQDQGLVRTAWAFEWYVRNHDARDRLQAGTYSLRPNQGVVEIVNILTHGKVATDKVTILPGQRLDQVREALINNAGFSAAGVDAALNSNLYSDSPALSDKPSGANLEGYLYPETFQKTADTKPEVIIRASLDQMQKHLTPEIRAAIVKQGLTVHEGVILASIIEQEVSNPKDKPVVAQIFLRRLKEGMQLGSDVTAFYGAIKAGQTPSVTYDSPYNTRLHPGLPPGPISNVSASSLAAVAQPASTDYLYFVAGDDGVTYFSHTLQEHQALTAQHCKKLCE
ncbi:MAG TPA: endolytic transglycosylase MltG, partial [Candidatus Saccharimonadales bacterium]|nr:endolytic transglycosylase MltG [Candidatus Saccharimonadales bacterium]